VYLDFLGGLEPRGRDRLEREKRRKIMEHIRVKMKVGAFGGMRSQKDSERVI